MVNVLDRLPKNDQGEAKKLLQSVVYAEGRNDAQNKRDEFGQWCAARGYSAAADTLESKGWKVLQAPRTEDWGQTTSRFLSPSGALCGVAETPWARELSGS